MEQHHRPEVEEVLPEALLANKLLDRQASIRACAGSTKEAPVVKEKLPME